MSVKGSLESVGLEDLLQADLASEGGGKLTLRHGPHHAAIYVGPDGMYVKHPDLMLPDLLIDAFVNRGLLDPEAVARARRSHLHGARLLDELVNEGALPEAEYMEVLAAEVEDTVLDMMLWEEGWFRFAREPFVAASMGLLARICVDPRGVTERALERLEERRVIGDLLGNHALLFIASGGELPPPMDERDILHDVYARLDGRTTVHEIALLLGRSRFAVLAAIKRMAEAGLARPAEGEELVPVADAHVAAGRITVGRHLILQWVERAPQDPAPLRKLAELAAEARSKDAELDALCALGHLHIRNGDPDQALVVFTRAMEQSPADDVVLAGMRVAAAAAGDTDALLDSTLLTAQTKLDEEQTEEALALIEPLRETHAANMTVHLLYARALVQGEKRIEFFQHAEAVGRVLANEGCHSNVDREAVEFFRETITHLAPDRGDLLERFRSIYDPRRSRRRRVGIVCALLLLIGGGGFYFWPPSARSLLEKAQTAVNDGEKESAREWIAKLVERYPESPEAEEAILLQRRLFPPKRSTKRRDEALRELKAALERKMSGFTAALEALPGETAQATIRDVVDLLGVSAAQPLRKKALHAVSAELRTAAQRLLSETMDRVDALARTSTANEKLKNDPKSMLAFISDAERVRDPAWLERVRSSAKVLFGLSRLHEDQSFRRVTSELIRGVDALDKAAQFHDKHMPAVRLSFASLQIEEADRRCREEAPKFMVAGQLDRADQVYAHFETLLQEYATDPLYAALVERVSRRQLPQLIAERREQIGDIRRRITQAKAAEERDDLDEAVRLYADLVKTYWLIRFEQVFTLPLRVTSVPTGARVVHEGREVGRTPLIVRYPWGSKGSITLEAPGYTPAVHSLLAVGGQPASAVRLALAPAPLWSTPVSDDVRLQPLAVNGDILVVDRRGRIKLYDGAAGTVRWSQDHASLEGVRGRPAHANGIVYVPQVDGRVWMLSSKDGRNVGSMRLPRLHGDAAASGRRVGFVASNGTFVTVEGRSERSRKPLDATPAAGVVAAHGAFWVGTIDGALIRIDAGSGAQRTTRVTKNRAAVIGIGADADGVYATTAHGSLVAFDAHGRERWRQDKIGDLVGAPARAGRFVGVAGRDGVVALYAAKDGTPGKRFVSASGPRGGLVTTGGNLLLVRESGRLWVCDADRGEVLIDADVKADATFAPVVLPNGNVALAMNGHELGVVSAPARPAPAQKPVR